MTRLLEICCADAESVDAAISGGADRIELCSALSEGGLTPSKGLIDYACSRAEIPVNVLIRPRGGDFVYSEAETDIMISDIEYAAKAGAAGVVIGALNVDGTIDFDCCERLVSCAKSHKLTVTFHRAFDLSSDPILALANILLLRCDRLLTSGQAADAIQGSDLIGRLVKETEGKLIILAGAGVTPANAANLIDLTGATELHASAKTTRRSAMTYRNTSATMGRADADEYSRTVTSAEIVAQLANIIHSKP